jgi:tetratricopeptide (TPR) repeat protein
MAQSIYERALALRPGDFRIRLNLALLVGRLGDSSRSADLLVRLRAEQPESAIVHHNLGAMVLSSGDPGTAAAHLRAALASDPDSIGSKAALAQAYFDQGLLELAEAELIHLMGRNPWIAQAYDLLGLIAARQGDHALAVERHRKAVSISPYDAVFQHHLGRALQGGHALAEAKAAYEAALAAEPAFSAAMSDLGLVHAQEGRFDRAAELYLQALDIDPIDAVAAHRLGMALRGQGRTKEAIGAFCLALSLRPELSPARVELAELGSKVEECGR